MNASGVWVAGRFEPNTVWLPVNEWIGFVRKVSVARNKTIYIGISGDDVTKIKVNGIEILNTTRGGINIKSWSIFPVNVIAGDNYIEMSVLNYQGEIIQFQNNPGGFAAEIYDMTLQQLQAARSEADLNIIFRTSDMVGQPFDVGTTIGWSCQPGWQLIKDELDNYICIKTQFNSETFNEVHLPILIKNPKFPEARKTYIQSNKQYKVLSAVIEKEWECKTDILPDIMHEKIAVMLAHDNIHFTNHKIDSDVYKKDDYDIDWPDSDTSETAIATFKVNTPFASGKASVL